MSTPVGSSQWMYATASDFYPYLIDQSLRFDDPNNAYLLRNTNAGDRQKWTWSAWVKRSTLGTRQAIFSEGSSNSSHATYFDSDDTILTQERNSGSNRYVNQTSAVFRDVGAWMHICYAVDTTQATDSDRLKLYVNGVLQTLVNVAAATYPPLNTNTNMNVGSNHFIGYAATNANLCFDGYMAELHFVDGTQYAATDFAEEINGIWVPKEFTGSHGIYGYYLNFSTNSFTDNATDPDVFADQAGSNDLNAYNLAASDVVLDSPTNNFATLNILQDVGNATFSEGNLRLAGSGSDYDRAFSTIGLTSGKWYAEFRYISGDNRGFFGVIREDSYTQVAGDYIGELANQYGLDFRARSYSNNVELFDTTDFSTGDIGLLCFDIDNGKIYFGRRDISGATTIWYDSAGANNGDPSAGTNPTYTGTFTGHTWFIGCSDFNTTTVHANFGADGSFSGGITSGGLSDANGNGDFNYIEDGFLALCSANLPEPTISPNAAEQADDYFNTVLYTGNGNAGRTVTGINHSPDWVWIKERDATVHHYWFDTVRGATKNLHSSLNTGTGEATDANSLTSFDSDGFTVGTDGAVNGLNDLYVAWNWKLGGSSNTFNIDGAGYATASAAGLDGGDINPDGASISTTAGVSIITYTGNGGSDQTIQHGLASVPLLTIIKDRDNNSSNDNWWFGSSLVGEKYFYFTDIAPTGSTAIILPTSGDDTTITIARSPTNATNVNQSTHDFIMYNFHSVEGFSRIGTYDGNSSATDGTFVFTGFSPAFVMGKAVSRTGRWWMYDSARSPQMNYSIGTGTRLEPNSDGPEDPDSNANAIQFLSNGFKVNTSNGEWNLTGESYIYLAFAEAPAKYSNAR